jgi:hypothetical protein
MKQEARVGHPPNGWGDFGSLGIYISPSLILINGRARYPNVNQ